MTTLQKMGNGYNRNVLELVGKSSDIKPTNATGGIENQYITNGSTLFLMDTGEAFMFDYDTDSWVAI